MNIIEELYNIFFKPFYKQLLDSPKNWLKTFGDLDFQQKFNEMFAKATYLSDNGKQTLGGAAGGTTDVAMAKAKEFADFTDGIFQSMQLMAAGIETLSFGQVDLAPNLSFAKPSARAMFEIGAEVFSAEYRYGVIPKVQRFIQELTTPLIPEPYRLALQVSKGYLAQADYIVAMMQSGYNPDWAENWALEQEVYPTAETLIQMLRRGVITEDKYNLAMKRQAFNDDAITWHRSLRSVIPPISDLIRFAVREAFEDHSADKQYPNFERIAGQMGLTPEAAGWYWYAHWDRIGLGQMYDNLHRGLWDKAKFLDMLRIVDIHPDDRESIYNVAFSPPSIRELGYGFDTGAYTREDIIKYRRWAGLSPEDADKSATALVIYRTEAERNAARTEHMYAFGRGKETEEQLRKNLATLLTNPVAIELWVERAQLYKQRITKPEIQTDYKIPTASDILWAFEHDKATEAQARKMLEDLDWTPERIELNINRSKYEIEQAKAKITTPEPRKLTLALMRDLYAIERLSADNLVQLLIGTGYTKEDAEKLTSLIQYDVQQSKKPKELTATDITKFYDVRAITIADMEKAFVKLGYDLSDAKILTLYSRLSVDFPDLKAMYTKGWIDASTLASELMKLGLSSDRAKELTMTVVAYNSGERTSTERDLTKAEIVKGVKNGILTVAQGAGLLEDLGYDENEAYYILAINKVLEAGDPQGYWEMKWVTEQQKKARGLTFKVIPDEVILLERQLNAQRSLLQQLKETKASEEQLAQASLALGELEKQLRELIVSKKLQ